MPIRGRNKGPLASMTMLEATRESKLRAQEELEMIEGAGQSSDLKAKEYIKHNIDEQEKELKSFFYQSLETLHLFSKKRILYNRYLVSIFLKFASEEDIPKKYGVEVDVTDIGLIVKIAGTRYQGAFAASGVPLYDFHAAKIMAVKLGNTVAKLEGYVHTTEGGVIIPDEEDYKQYGRKPRTN